MKISSLFQVQIGLRIPDLDQSDCYLPIFSPTEMPSLPWFHVPQKFFFEGRVIGMCSEWVVWRVYVSFPNAANGCDSGWRPEVQQEWNSLDPRGKCKKAKFVISGFVYKYGLDLNTFLPLHSAGAWQIKFPWMWPDEQVSCSVDLSC